MQSFKDDAASSRRTAVAAFVLLVAIGLAGRLVPHPPNVTPIVAATLFAGFLFRPGRVGVAVPLLIMLLSDSLIGFYDWRLMSAVYAAFILPVVFSPIIRARPTVLRASVCSVLSSTAFFIVSNLAVWAFTDLYGHSIAGLGACYVAAIPFFRNTLLGDLAWCSVFFGLYGIIVRIAPAASLRVLIRQRQVIPAPIV